LKARNRNLEEVNREVAQRGIAATKEDNQKALRLG
jgi:hypothetical protein